MCTYYLETHPKRWTKPEERKSIYLRRIQLIFVFVEHSMNKTRKKSEKILKLIKKESENFFREMCKSFILVDGTREERKKMDTAEGT